MTILNVDEIERCGITEQPIEYNSEYELINWLKYDLLQQARRNGKEPDKNNIITITDEEEKEYTLHIGIKDYKNDIKNKIIINFSLEKVLFYFSIKYSNVNKLHYNLRLENLIVKNKLDFSYNKFFNIFDCNIEFYNIKFEKDILFEDLILMKEIYFGGCCFKDTLCFFCSKMNRKIWISNSIFENGISFGNNHIDSIEITESYLNKELKLKSNKIKKIDIIEINTNNNEDIKEKNYNAKITADNIIFNDNISFINLNNLKKVNEININNTFINGRINLKNIEVKEADFQGSVINGGLINPVNFKVHKFANRESALFLKNEAYARNNAIDALEYKAKEIDKHKEDLIKDWQKNKDFKTFGDILSIELSSLYSDNGQNWIRAFICTILFPTVFFTLSYTNFKVGLYFYMLLITYAINILFFKDILKYIINSILVYLIVCILLPLLYIGITSFDESYIKELFMFLIPTNFEQIKESIYIYNDNTLFRGFNYFIGKIAFWYGSVQTVTAFRKFAKGA
ncbi:hypothetical protein R4L75_04570 [Brachyspira pilosicoli]|uniref:hypothetical protein n=1 Tax=Brachyspira pilosicoli TaxID=52584 RepID=UPI003004D9ED